MIESDEIWESIRRVTEFTVTEDHLKLLRHAYESWHDAEYGSPSNDPNAEMAIALQIVLATGEFRPGRYTRSERWATDWTRQEN